MTMSNAGLIAVKDMIFAQTVEKRPRCKYVWPAAPSHATSHVPCRVGAAVACPDRKTVVFEGDVSGMYTPQTLWKMAREKAGVTVVVMKNDSYGILNIELTRVLEGDEMLSMLNIENPSLDWVKLAEAQTGQRHSACTSSQSRQSLAVRSCMIQVYGERGRS